MSPKAGLSAVLADFQVGAVLAGRLMGHAEDLVIKGASGSPVNLRTARSAFAETAYHNTGLYNVGGTGAYPQGGEGLATHTLRPSDMGRFRTPSLRNVALTAPYMHDGSVATLEDAIRHYAAGGRIIPHGAHAGVGADSPWKDPLIVGFAASPDEIADLVAFLDSLTDRSFITNRAFADPWPTGHPASATRRMPGPSRTREPPS